MAFVDDTSDQQDLPILTAFNGFFHKKCATAEQKRCMQYVFIIYICTTIVKSPVDFWEFWVGDGSVGFLRLATFWVFFWEAWHGHCIAKPRNHQNSFYSAFKPLGQSQTIPKNPPSRNLWRGFFSISLFRLSVSTPPKNTQKTSKNHHSYPSPPEKNNRSSKQKKHQHQQPSHQVIQAMTFPLEVTNTKRAQKNCQAQRIARWFGFRLNPRMKGIVNLGVALKSQTTNRPQTDNYPPWN